MKNYKEMSDSVIERVKEYKEKQKKRKKKIKKATLSVACLSFAALVVAGAWQIGLFGNNTTFKTEAEISKDDSYVSNNIVAEENTKKTTTTTKRKPTTKSTTKKETTTKDVVEPEMTSESTTNSTEYVITTNSIPIAFEMPQKMIYYYDGISGGYPLMYAKTVAGELTRYVMDGWVEFSGTKASQAAVDKLKKSERAVELLYGTQQSIEITFVDETTKTFTFDSVLFALSGENQGLLFFGKNGTYVSAPIKSSRTHCVDSILSIYHFELLTF